MNPDVRANYTSIKSELLQNSNILSVTSAWQIPSFMSSNTSGWDWEGKDPQRKELMGYTCVDFDYTKTFNIEMAAGRFYSPDFPSDSTKAIVVNEKFIEVTGIEDPIGKRVSLGGGDYSIIGVTKNFHFKSMHYSIEPFALVFHPPHNNIMFARINGTDVTKTLDSMKEVFKKFNPNYPFEYAFVDEDYDKLYRSEMRMSKLFSYFTILAITISCLGLFALSAFTVEQKTKEIGIRKVLGASVTTIVTLLSKEFLLLVTLSSLIACPISWLIIKGWLQGFAYRLEFNDLFWIFPISIGVALFIAILTINFQTIKAASTDPVKALKYE
jgi:ABC-type antimicrobial peptide transport system permease subunit